MKKFIVALDGLRLSESSLAYAVLLAKQSNAHLVGVFLDDPTHHSYSFYELLKQEEGYSESKRKLLEEKDAASRYQANIEFEVCCRNASISYSVHHDKNIATIDLLHETLFADLLVIQNNESFTRLKENAPSRFIKEILADAHCPVLLVPESYRSIDQIVLLYDGEPASINAIKTFSYILPVLKQFPAEVISVNVLKNSSHIPDNRLMKEFMKRHYPDIIYKVFNGFADVEIINYLNETKKHPIIVLGTNQRGVVSRLFRENMTAILLKHVHMPLFIVNH